MKKIIGVLMVLAAGSTLAFADTVAAPAKAPATPVVKTEPVVVPPAAPVAAEHAVTGKVKAVSLPDMAKGLKSEIVITDDAGHDGAVLVKAVTTLYDADAKAITLDKVAPGAKVNVIYTVTSEGVNEAKSVKIVK